VEYRPQGLRRAFPQDRAGLSDGAGAHPQAVHLCRGRLGRRRLSVEDARRRRGVLFGGVARRHPRALRHGSADQVFPHRLRDRQLGRGGAAPGRGVAKGFGSLPYSNWLWLTPGCATMSLCPGDGYVAVLGTGPYWKGVGASSRSRPFVFRSDQNAAGIGWLSQLTFCRSCATVRIPATNEAIAGWASTNCIAAAGSGTSCARQIASILLTRSMIPAGAGP